MYFAPSFGCDVVSESVGCQLYSPCELISAVCTELSTQIGSKRLFILLSPGQMPGSGAVSPWHYFQRQVLKDHLILGKRRANWAIEPTCGRLQTLQITFAKQKNSRHKKIKDNIYIFQNIIRVYCHVVMNKKAPSFFPANSQALSLPLEKHCDSNPFHSTVNFIKSIQTPIHFPNIFTWRSKVQQSE